MTGLTALDLKAGYQDHAVVSGVSFEVAPRTVFGLIGPNGSGKTTLFKCMCGILRPWEGTIRLGGEDVSRIPRRRLARIAAFIPQIHSVTFPYTVEEYVLMGRYPHRGRMSAFTREDRSIVDETMEMLQIAHVRRQRLQRLSGGEMQRVFLACGLVQKPEILLMDEPTSHLDIGHQVRLLTMLRRLSQETGLTVLITLHDLNLAGLYCTSLALLDNGLIHAQGSPEEVLTRDNIEQVYKVRSQVARDPFFNRPHVYFLDSRE
ncbi:MAG TPA: ABC transporter ATP-binding protein [Deltaproteobacteria bacterium]|nr:ABC transporter ATP-binding protein [Deltaproteobacteria bacterium]HPR55763.1 ABC transporter ATP-binding protein [Deltaproteobacteria bacterium]HXK47521.1 ABC transporter ATP-binding protein [Deltaproteobacteria bacterium]